jgi:hypothetical protein
VTCGRFHHLPWLSCTMAITTRRAHRFAPAPHPIRHMRVHGWTHHCVSCAMQFIVIFSHLLSPPAGHHVDAQIDAQHAQHTA